MSPDGWKAEPKLADDTPQPVYEMGTHKPAVELDALHYSGSQQALVELSAEPYREVEMVPSPRLSKK
jgi:hypothetical protein